MDNMTLTAIDKRENDMLSFWQQLDDHEKDIIVGAMFCFVDRKSPIQRPYHEPGISGRRRKKRSPKLANATTPQNA